MMELSKYEFDIVALQETKPVVQEVSKIEEYLFFNSGGKSRMLGTGSAIKKEMKSAIIDFKPISDRMAILRMRRTYQKITFITIHAPSEEKDAEIKENFYSEIDKNFETIPKYDLNIILGDANVKIGKEVIYMPAIGKYSLHDETNENGRFLIDIAKEKKYGYQKHAFSEKKHT